MFKLKFRLAQPLADNRATAEQQNSWFHPERNLDPAQKNNIHGPTDSLTDSAIAGDGGIGGNA